MPAWLNVWLKLPVDLSLESRVSDDVDVTL